jgi:MFS family permease
MGATGATLAGKTGESPYRWLILILTVLSFVLTFLCRFSWPPLIPVIVPVIHMNMSQAGAYMSAFYIGYVITQIPAGILADRFGVRAVLGFTLVIEGIAQFWMGNITSFQTGFWLRVIIGLAAGADMSCCVRAIMEWFAPRDRGMAFGCLLAGPTLGLLIANYLVPALNSTFDWRVAYHIVGVAVVILGILVYLLIKASSDVKQAQSIFGGVPAFFTNRDLVLLGFGGFCVVWMEIGFAAFANTFIKKQLGFSIKEAGLILVCYSVGGILASPVSGWISDLVGHRKQLVMGAYALAVVLTIVFGYQSTLQMLMIVGFIYGFCSYFANPHLSLMIAEIAGRDRSATATGISNVIFQIGSILSPLALGMSIDITHTFHSIWYILAVGPLVGIVVMSLVRPPTAAQSSV